jgi:hypothetical protein
VEQVTTVFAEGPMKGVSNNPVMFAQHVPQSSFSRLCPICQGGMSRCRADSRRLVNDLIYGLWTLTRSEKDIRDLASIKRLIDETKYPFGP